MQLRKSIDQYGVAQPLKKNGSLLTPSFVASVLLIISFHSLGYYCCCVFHVRVLLGKNTLEICLPKLLCSHTHTGCHLTSEPKRTNDVIFLTFFRHPILNCLEMFAAGSDQSNSLQIPVSRPETSRRSKALQKPVSRPETSRTSKALQKPVSRPETSPRSKVRYVLVIKIFSVFYRSVQSFKCAVLKNFEG